MKTTFLFVVLAVPVSAACSSPPSDVPDAASDGATACVTPSTTCQNHADPPSYASTIAPLIKTRCSPCHFPGGISSQIYDLSTYKGVQNAGTAIINELYDCKMPPVQGLPQYSIAPGSVPGITVEQASTLVDWIACGTPDN